MNAIQDNSQGLLQVAAPDVRRAEDHEMPILVEQFAIDELAVREEYAACHCGGN